MLSIKQALEEILTCKVCQSLLNTPRILPCAHTFCTTCIHTTLRSKKTNIVECPICNAKHAYNTSNFIINKLGSEVIDAINLDDDESDTELTRKLDNRDLITSYNQKIDAHFILFLKQFDSITERKVKEAYENQKEIVRQIDAYENECSESYSAFMQSHKPDFDSFLSKMNHYYDDVQDLLSQFELGHQYIEELCSQTIECIEMMDQTRLVVREEKFNGKLLKVEFSDCAGPALRHKSLNIDELDTVSP